MLSIHHSLSFLSCSEEAAKKPRKATKKRGKKHIQYRLSLHRPKTRRKKDVQTGGDLQASILSSPHEQTDGNLGASALSSPQLQYEHTNTVTTTTPGMPTTATQ